MIGTTLENILEKYMFKVTKSVSIYLGDNTDICNRATEWYSPVQEHSNKHPIPNINIKDGH